MYIVSTPRLEFLLISRDGDVYRFKTLNDLARDLIAAGYYSHGGVYGLSHTIVERFTTTFDAWTGQRYADGHYVVEGSDGERLSREAVAQACVEYRVAHRKRASGRGWYHRPRRSKVVTLYDRRHAEHARLDLQDLDPRYVQLVETHCRIADPYEPAPRRTPQRSWKSHRGHQYKSD